MFQYLFTLGRKYQLSTQEIEAIFPDIEKEYNNQYLLLNSEKEINVKEVMLKLGGTIQIAKVLSELKEKELNDFIVNFLNEKYPDNSKIKFGISTVNFPVRILTRLLLDVKKGLKKKEKAGRFVNKNFKNLSLPIIKSEGFLRGKGSEILLVQEEKNFIVAETMAVQDIDAYSKRDFDKPFRDAKMGMLPPKLAQIMLNLAQVKKGGIVWDPFCGSGTVLMEALLQDYQVLGSDIEKQNVAGTEHNLWWIKKEFGLDQDYEVFQQDVTERLPEDLDVDAVVCEGLLGKPKSFLPEKSVLDREIHFLEGLYEKAFRNFKKVLKPGTVIVIALPCFKDGSYYIYLKNILAQIKSLGYDVASLSNSERQSLIYDRKDQVVGREIFKFTIR